MRLAFLLLLSGCATTQGSTANPSCESRCKTNLDLCQAQCSTYALPSAFDSSTSVAAANCRSNCWDRDITCQARCAEQPKRE